MYVCVRAHMVIENMRYNIVDLSNVKVRYYGILKICFEFVSSKIIILQKAVLQHLILQVSLIF